MNYVSLAQYLLIAEHVTGVPAEVLEKTARVDLADSALHAPAAGFGDDDFYPDLTDKAAILCARLVLNHPLPDGNKRSAWLTMVDFIDRNGGTYAPASVDEVEAMVVGLAAHEVDEDAFADWLREHISW